MPGTLPEPRPETVHPQGAHSTVKESHSVNPESRARFSVGVDVGGTYINVLDATYRLS